MRTQQETRKLSYDVINIIACIGVVALHHNGLVHTYNGGTAGWVQSLVIECLCYASVPLFMMLSGANLLRYLDRYSTKVYFKKRVSRTVIPWLAWSLIFLIWQWATKEIQLNQPILLSAINKITAYEVESTYWFFGQLFACYLAMPVLSALRENRKALWYMAGINFVFVSVLPIVRKWVGLSGSLSVPITGRLIMFVVLGYLLSTTEIPRKGRIVLYFAGAGCVLFRFIYTLYFSRLTGVTDTSIKGYETFHSVIYACALFVFLSRIPWDKMIPDSFRKFIRETADCSFGIYLIHHMFMKYESRLLGIDTRGWQWRILFVPVTYLLCLLLVRGMKKIPLLKRIV